AGTDTLFGDDVTMADVVWSGPQPSFASQASAGGVTQTAPAAALAERVTAALAKGRAIHFLAPYRAEQTLKIAALLGIAPDTVKGKRSAALHRAVVAQRSYKSADEVADIERAIDVSREMYAAAMKAVRPGRKE